VKGFKVLAGPDAPASIVLTVTDAGVGMNAATVEHCFDKFWQADASGTRRFGGTGIGSTSCAAWWRLWAARFSA